MNPILYSKTETDFSHMGIGVLSDTLSCHVTQDTGCYELEMEYPIGGIHFDSIEHSCWLKVICPPRMEASPQLFYIVHISKPLNKKVTILAHHVSYKLNFIPIKPFSAHVVSDLFTQIKSKSTEANPFTFETDKGAFPVNMSYPYPVMAMSLLGGQEGSLLDLAGGEFIWDNYKVTFKDEVGEDTGYELRYGVNVTDLKQEENISDTITGVVPYWFNEGYENDPDTLVMLPETTLYSSNVSDYPFRRSVTVDFSSEIEATYDDDHKIVPPTVAQLRELTKEYIKKAGIGVPKVSIEVSMENLARSAEYEHLKNLQQVKLYDTVTVIFPLLHIQKKAKVVKTVYDVQQQKYISITIGEKRASASLSDRFVTPEDVSSIFDENSSFIDGAINKVRGQIDTVDGKVDTVDGKVDAVDGKVDTEVARLEDEFDEDVAEIKTYADTQLAILDTTLRTKINNDIKASSDAIMGGKGGYVVMHQSNETDPPHVDEILIMNTNKESTATNIIRLNKNGIGFSTNGGVSYTTAWTIGGSFNANYISGKTISSLTLTSGTINSGVIRSIDMETVTFKSGSIEAATINAGNKLTFNYLNNDNTSGRVTVGSGSITTRLTANDPITYRGQVFQSSKPGTGNDAIDGWRDDGILMDAYNFVVTSREFAVSSQYGSYHAGITTANMIDGGTNPHLIMVCQKDADGGSGKLVGRLDCGPGYIGVAIANSNVDRSISLDYIIAVEGTSTGGRSGTYYIPAASHL